MSEALGGVDLYQLHFGHSGEFPGMLVFTFEATENEPGDTVYLYYYYGEANVIEAKAEVVVDENGMVTFEIYHCSSYVVTGEVVSGAIRNFDPEAAQAFETMEATLAETQTALEESQTSEEALQTENAALEEELSETQAALEEERDEEPEAAPIDKASPGISWLVFIIVLAAVLLLSVLLTMLLSRAGLFKRLGEKKSVE